MARSPPQAPYKRAAGEENFANYMLIYTILHDFPCSDSAPRYARSDQKFAAAPATAAAAAAAAVLLLLLRHRCAVPPPLSTPSPRPPACGRSDRRRRRPRGGSRQRCHRQPAATLSRPPPGQPPSALAAAQQQPGSSRQARRTAWCRSAAHMPQMKSLRAPPRTHEADHERRQATKKTADRQSTGRGTAQASSAAYRTL